MSGCFFILVCGGSWWDGFFFLGFDVFLTSHRLKRFRDVLVENGVDSEVRFRNAEEGALLALLPDANVGEQAEVRAILQGSFLRKIDN